MLDPRISGFLGQLAEVSLLKEHGVEQCASLTHLPAPCLWVALPLAVRGARPVGLAIAAIMYAKPCWSMVLGSSTCSLRP